MLKGWAILFLCGLLHVQQAVAEKTVSAVVTVDKAVLEKVFSDIFDGGKLFQGILGTNLLELLGGGQRNQGLLGGVLGDLGRLLDLKIVKIVLPEVTLNVSNASIELKIAAKVELDGNMILKQRLNLMVGVNISANVQFMQDESGVPKLVVKGCKTNLVEIKLLSGPLLLKLDKALSNLLNSLLSGLLCPRVDLALNGSNTLLGKIDTVRPSGMLRNLHYSPAKPPLLDNQQLTLKLNLLITDKQGNTANVAPVKLSALPPVVDHASRLLLSDDILSALLGLLVTNGELNVDTTKQGTSGDASLTTSALQSILPQVSQLVQENLPLVFKITISDKPLVSFENGNIAVTFKISIEAFAQASSGLIPLFTVVAECKSAGTAQITGTELRVTLVLESLSLRLVSSEIGSIDVSLLQNLIERIIQTELLPKINAALNVQLPLWESLNLEYADGRVKTQENAFVAPLIPRSP